jgi:hypothetical protein
MRARGKLLLALVLAATASAQDPRELVRRAIAQDQLDLMRMKDYTWHAQSVERHFDSHGKVESTKREAWETLVLYGQAQRRMLERDGKPLSPEEQRAEQRRLDQAATRLSSETPAEKQRRLDEAEKRRKHEFAFLTEIPDLFDLRLEGDAIVDGRPVWVVSGSPRPGAQPKSRDAKMLLKMRGRMWIDKSTYQWAKVEAQTIGTISWGWFLARLDSGAKMTFEQTEVNAETWLPKRLFVSGSGRVGLIKRLAEDQEIRWSNYKRFSVDSRVLADPPPTGPRH